MIIFVFQFVSLCAWRQRNGQPERAFERGVWQTAGGPAETPNASLPALFGNEIESNNKR